MNKIIERLYKEADKEYRDFNKKIMPDADKMLGIRMPVLHKIAKEIYKNGNWQEFLKIEKCIYWEELMLQAMLISEIKSEPNVILKYVKDFIPKLTGWGVCDCFCGGLKFTKNNKKLVWDFIQPYFKSNGEYEKRFAYVMLLTYFCDEDYIDESLKQIDKFKDERYYAKMAVAWALSICYIKNPEKTQKYLSVSKLDKWTYNKGIQKICESLRIDKKTKNFLKTLKR